MSNYNNAKLIANQTSGIHKGVAKVMQLCTEIADERDELKKELKNTKSFINSKATEVRKLKSQLAECKRQRDESLGELPLFEKNKAEMQALSSEDLRPALVLALCQRDIALRSVEKIHAISKLLTAWDRGKIDEYENFITTGDIGRISDFDVIRHIIDTILKPVKTT